MIGIFFIIFFYKSWNPSFSNENAASVAWSVFVSLLHNRGSLVFNLKWQL